MTQLATLIVPFYRNVKMLREQLGIWVLYPQEVWDSLGVIVVDDGSPEPAREVILESGFDYSRRQFQLYRILKDIPWNRNGARNLGAHVAAKNWILQTDIDHVLPVNSAIQLVRVLPTLSAKQWYRFRRFRRGRADETRKKDRISPNETYGEIKPHGDSYLCTREHYWKAGGYNEDFTGCLGGGSPFQRELEKIAPAALAPSSVSLEVYTRDVCEDASDNTLSRDTSEYARRRKALERAGKIKGHNPLRFPWERQL